MIKSSRTPFGWHLSLPFCVVTMLLCFIPGPSARAMFPSVLLFTGGNLKEPVALTDAYAIADFHRSLRSYRGAVAKGPDPRKALKMSAFWGGKWSAFVAGGGHAASLAPELANQHGFIDTRKDSPVLLHQTAVPRILDSPAAAPLGLDDYPISWQVGGAALEVLREMGVIAPEK